MQKLKQRKKKKKKRPESCAEKKFNPTLARVVRIEKFFGNQNNELYCMFLKAVIPFFDSAK